MATRAKPSYLSRWRVEHDLLIFEFLIGPPWLTWPIEIRLNRELALVVAQALAGFIRLPRGAGDSTSSSDALPAHGSLLPDDRP